MGHVPSLAHLADGNGGVALRHEPLQIAARTLDLPVEPYWLALPRGVRVEIRPVTTAVMAAAQAASARRLSALRAAEPELDPDMARGLAFAYCHRHT